MWLFTEKRIELSEITPGNYFVYEGTVYLRTKRLNTTVNPYSIIVVDSAGLLCEFSNNSLVLPVYVHGISGNKHIIFGTA